MVSKRYIKIAGYAQSIKAVGGMVAFMFVLGAQESISNWVIAFIV